MRQQQQRVHTIRYRVSDKKIAKREHTFHHNKSTHMKTRHAGATIANALAHVHHTLHIAPRTNSQQSVSTLNVPYCSARRAASRLCITPMMRFTDLVRFSENTVSHMISQGHPHCVTRSSLQTTGRVSGRTNVLLFKCTVFGVVGMLFPVVHPFKNKHVLINCKCNSCFRHAGRQRIVPGREQQTPEILSVMKARLTAILRPVTWRQQTTIFVQLGISHVEGQNNV